MLVASRPVVALLGFPFRLPPSALSASLPFFFCDETTHTGHRSVIGHSLPYPAARANAMRRTFHREVNPILLATIGLLVVMGVSIALAILYPYVDTNALEAEATAAAAASESVKLQNNLLAEGAGSIVSSDAPLSGEAVHDVPPPEAVAVADDSSAAASSAGAAESPEREDEGENEGVISLNIDAAMAAAARSIESEGVSLFCGSLFLGT